MKELEIKKEFHPIYETAMLVHLFHHKDSSRDSTLEEMNNLGISNNKRVEGYFKLLDRYIKTFKRHKVAIPGEDYYYEHDDGELNLILTMFLMAYPDIYKNIDRYTEESLADVIHGYFKGDETINCSKDFSIIETIKKLEVKDSTKWSLLTISDSPKEKIGKFVNIIKENQKVYKLTLSDMEKPLGKVLKNAPHVPNQHFQKILKGVSDNEEIELRLSLATPFVELIGLRMGIYGVFTDELFNHQNNKPDSKETVIMKLKALADKSRFDIMESLKKKPKYNLQIAEELGVTPATASHHMNILLSSGLVMIEKQDGKIYYKPDDGEINRLLDELKRNI